MADKSKEDRSKGEQAAALGIYGTVLDSLIAKAEQLGLETLYRIFKASLARTFASSPNALLTTDHILNGDELAELTRQTASVMGTGNLIGHAEIRIKQEKADRLHVYGVTEPPKPAALGYGGGGSGPLGPKFPKGPGSGGPWEAIGPGSSGGPEVIFRYDPEAFNFLQPYDAIEYFKSLVPRMGVDPIRWEPLMQRTAFTVARATEKAVVEKIQSVILEQLRTGEGFRTGPAAIDSILADVGVHPKNPQYAQMVNRTNLMDSYTTGYQIELEHPEVKNFFPVWKYLGIRDGRQGKDHEIRFDNYYPNTLTFHAVRGERVFNCRCCPSAIDKYKWKKLADGGAIISGL